MAAKNSREEDTAEAAATMMLPEEAAASKDSNEDGEKEDEEGDEAELEEADECRICRSSALELLEAEAAAGGSCCGCYQRQPRQPPLRRLRCACAGSVRHVCDRCYGRYYVARGLTACEICRQPTGLEGLSDGDANDGFCRRLSTFACSSEARLLVYALFIFTAFVSIFVLFFVAADATDGAAAASPSGTTSSATPPRSEPQRRLERTIFVAIASLNLGVALAYIGYSYWRHCHGGRCCGRSSSSGSQEHQHQHQHQHQQQVQQQTAATSIAIEAITVTILQQPPLLAATEVDA